MARNLVEGLESVGHIEGLEDDLSPGYLKLDARGAVISVPEFGATSELFDKAFNSNDDDTPRHLRFLSTATPVVLGECRALGTSVSLMGTALTRVRARRVVASGLGEADYAEVDGMTTEIDGLAKWAGLTSVSQTVERDPIAIVLRAQNQPVIKLGGDADVTVESSFIHNPGPQGNTFSITDLALLRTRSTELWPWEKHATVHHMFQDLMCLVYGKPCLSRIASVKREDDQPHSTDDRRRRWREVYEPTFGRSAVGVAALDRTTDEPLFYLRHVDRAALTKWIDEWELWSRPTWIAVTTMFQHGTTVEAELLQVGVALEALGYALWQESGPRAGTRTPQYAHLLKLVTEATKVIHPAIYGSDTVKGWRRSFYNAFKGTKHADKPLPSDPVAHRFAAQGASLIRAWLGTRLGVDHVVLTEHLDRQ